MEFEMEILCYQIPHVSAIKISRRYLSSSSITAGIFHVPREGPDIFPPKKKEHERNDIFFVKSKYLFMQKQFHMITKFYLL